MIGEFLGFVKNDICNKNGLLVPSHITCSLGFILQNIKIKSSTVLHGFIKIHVAIMS